MSGREAGASGASGIPGPPGPGGRRQPHDRGEPSDAERGGWPGPDDVAWGADGLVPAVVQDPADGAVLMLAWMDREALEATRETGLVHFHSRSRGRLWRKGETSGNVLRLRGLVLDCDRDAILVAADPAGPTCHTGARSCFDAAGAGAREPQARLGEAVLGAARTPPGEGFAWLEELWSTIQRRREEADPGHSYTARLLEGGVDACARKVTEEATEVLLAARDDAEAERNGSAVDDPDRAPLRDALAGEVADLLYHVLVLIAERDLGAADVIDVLRARHRA